MSPITIHLQPSDYYRLRYLQSVAETTAAQAEVVALRAAAQAGRSHQVFVDALAAMARAQDFDSEVPYRWDDATTSLVRDEAASPASGAKE